MFRSMMKPVIRSLAKQAYCGYGVLCERHITSSSFFLKSKTTPMSSNTINVQYKKELMELEPEEANKSLYLCNVEYKSNGSPAYIIRTVRLSDLLSSSSLVPLRQVFHYAHPHFPLNVGCGVFKSEIFIVGGMNASCPPGSRWKLDVYKVGIHSNDPNESISKLKTNLQGAKSLPLTIELCGKLYVLSYELVEDSPTFEVFDPVLGKWEALPHPPFYQIDSPYFCDYMQHFSYVIANTKLFVFNRGYPFCFDAAHPGKEWRIVSTMDGPFRFRNKALALDLHGEDDKKIMFAYSSHPRPRLQVYLMSLFDEQETITKIGNVKIPKLPAELGEPTCVELFHIGGKKACVAVPVISSYVRECDYLVGHHTRYGAVIPFEYDLDMTKMKDKGEKNGLTVQFMPIRYFVHHNKPSDKCHIYSAKCFLL